MSEVAGGASAIREAWELDPTDRNGFKDPDDIVRRLARRAAHQEQLRKCKCCPLLGRGAICAAELRLPDPAAATMLMVTCETARIKGQAIPSHGSAELRNRKVGARILAPTL